jgi:3-isopropylmalate dehydrogenase
MYEPIHGSAPDIAGQNKANPIATVLSAAMMLRYSFGLEKEAVAIETAIEELLGDGWRTGDILGASDATPLSCTEMTAKILEYIK